VKTANRLAFTLVELLVVIVIIGVLIGMMLPGVQAAREAARRATCRTHLAQLGLAIQEHVAAYGVLPPGSSEPAGPIRNVPRGNHMGWIVRLLPYLDEGGTAKHVDFSAGVYAAPNTPVRALQISLLACPSETGAPGGAGSRPKGIGVSNYAGCHHDVEAPIDADNHGVLYLNSRISPRDVTDGPANTIYVGEKRSDADDLGWMSGTRATLRNTGTPINAPPASGGPKPPGPAAELAVGGFGSGHFGCAHFLFGDGAVRALGNDIDLGLFQQLGHRADGKLLTSGPTREP
jgi:prepilin-type N-terminal cleavage/methylation domain-containing protein